MKQPERYGDLNVEEITAYLAAEPDKRVRDSYFKEFNHIIQREVIKRIPEGDLRQELIQLDPKSLEKKAS